MPHRYSTLRLTQLALYQAGLISLVCLDLLYFFELSA